jgi:hypothetical protein
MSSASPDYPPEILALAERLRRFVRETVPEAEERRYKDGCSAGYHAPKRGAFCGIFPRRDAVYLAFPNGDQLPDPAGLLAASHGRYAVLRPGEAFPEEDLFPLLVAALLVGGGGDAAHGAGV